MGRGLILPTRRSLITGAAASLGAAQLAQATPRELLLLGQPPFCPAAQALFAAMTVQPPNALMKLYNGAIIALQGAGLWQLRDAYYWMCVHNAQAALLNIKNPGAFTLTPTAAPTFTSYVGYAGNGSSALLNTNFNPSTAGGNWTQNSASIFAWSLAAAEQAANLIGYASGAGRADLISIPYYTDGNSYGSINTSGSDIVAANSTGLGLYMVNRTSASAQQIYKNGASLGSNASTSVALPNLNAVFMAGNIAFFNGGVAMGGFGAALTGAQAAAEYAILNAFKTGANAL